MPYDPSGIVHNDVDIDDIINNDHPWHLLSIGSILSALNILNSFIFYINLIAYLLYLNFIDHRF